MEKRDRPVADPELKRRIDELIAFKGGGNNPDLVEDIIESALKLLRDVEDLPAEEVAARLQCSKATVRSHIANARVKLRKHFARLQKRGLA
jgi:transcriptional antiterminator